MDQVRDRIRRLGLALRTEEAYCGWIVRFIRSNGMRHPRVMGAPEVEAFLTLLASKHQVAASTQNQALSALLFLYREVLGIELPWMDDIRRAKRPERVPVVLTRDEVQRVFEQLSGVHWLVCGLLYGSGLRLLEALRLRVLDLDLTRLELTVRQGKGGKDRRTMLAQPMVEPCSCIWQQCVSCTSANLGWVRGGCCCRMCLPARVPRLPPSGAGSSCSPPVSVHRTRAAGTSAGIICTSPGCRRRCVRLSFVQAWTSMPAATPSATASPRICWRTVTTSARCRSCWGTAMSVPRRSTPTC